MPASSAMAGIDARGPRSTRSSGQEALYTSAAGVSGGYPPAMSSLASSFSMALDRNSTMEAP